MFWCAKANLSVIQKVLDTGADPWLKDIQRFNALILALDISKTN